MIVIAQLFVAVIAALLLREVPLVAGLAGFVAGCAGMFAELRWPRARRTYIDPVYRPQPMTRKKLMMIAAIMVLLGAFGWFAFAYLARTSVERSFLAYFAG